MVLPISCQSAIHRKKETYSNGCLQIYFVNQEQLVSVCLFARRVSVEREDKFFPLLFSNNTCISKLTQRFNENRTMINTLKVSQVSAMHVQRKEPEKDLRLEENSVSREVKNLHVLKYSQLFIAYSPRPFHPVFVLAGKRNESKGDAMGRIQKSGINSAEFNNVLA